MAATAGSHPNAQRLGASSFACVVPALAGSPAEGSENQNQLREERQWFIVRSPCFLIPPIRIKNVTNQIPKIGVGHLLQTFRHD
jgi:hypothetical protein